MSAARGHGDNIGAFTIKNLNRKTVKTALFRWFVSRVHKSILCSSSHSIHPSNATSYGGEMESMGDYFMTRMLSLLAHQGLAQYQGGSLDSFY